MTSTPERFDPDAATCRWCAADHRNDDGASAVLASYHYVLAAAALLRQNGEQGRGHHARRRVA